MMGAADIYGASRVGARRGMQVEMERQQAMEYEYRRREAAYEARRREEERQRAEDERRRAEELEREKEKVRREVEKEEREKAGLRAEQQYGGQRQHSGPPPSAYAGPDVVFCTQCGNHCKVGDKFCSRCGLKLPEVQGRS